MGEYGKFLEKQIERKVQKMMKAPSDSPVTARQESQGLVPVCFTVTSSLVGKYFQMSLNIYFFHVG